MKTNNINKITNVLTSVLPILLIFRLASNGKSVRMDYATRMLERFLLSTKLIVVCVLLVVFATTSAREITSFQAEGDCYALVARYLKERGVAYVISDDLKDLSCNWNFKGNTLADFQSWCKATGLKCGGNPFFVGYDSTWYDGEWVSRHKAQFLAQQKKELERERERLDSLANIKPDTLDNKSVTIEYLEIGKSIAERIGFSYSEYIGSAKFWDYTDLFSVTIQARDIGDTTFIYRTYTTQYDSSLHVFWGGSRDKIKQSNVTSNGVISNNYVTESYGLTFDLDNYHYSYTHASDYEHSISGSGKLSPGVNRIFGAFQRTYTLETGLPVLSRIPFLGALFRHVSDETETRYVFIYVTIGGTHDNGV